MYSFYARAHAHETSWKVRERPEEVLEMGLATSIQKQASSKAASQSVRDLIIRQMLVVPGQTPPPQKPPDPQTPPPAQHSVLELFAKF